ncbi:hypothetical protein Ahy_A05g024453 [Arachis hypogaea]|uniref:Uncharacterized protein n=1 Tax=Arachis hypogaea TaxID=3818 RepID=A0A445D6H1_ARAHY|nr:hypothetical protein Ahy_A05g024453 [Arachis hypogaea]
MEKGSLSLSHVRLRIMHPRCIPSPRACVITDLMQEAAGALWNSSFDDRSREAIATAGGVQALDIIHSMSHDAHPMGVLVNSMSALSVHHRDANPALKRTELAERMCYGNIYKLGHILAKSTTIFTNFMETFNLLGLLGGFLADAGIENLYDAIRTIH